MGNYPIEISGITPISHFPKCPAHHPCTEFCETDKVRIPYKKINMEKIRQVCLNAHINSFKIICTPAGKKIVIDGEKQIKVYFVSDNHGHATYCVDFNIPFCTFILLHNMQDEVVQICSVVEDVSVKCMEGRFLSVTSIIFVCPVFKKDDHLCPCPPEQTIPYQLQANYGMTPLGCHDKQQCSCHIPHDLHHS